jgi:hypothetical protein
MQPNRVGLERLMYSMRPSPVELEHLVRLAQPSQLRLQVLELELELPVVRPMPPSQAELER